MNSLETLEADLNKLAGKARFTVKTDYWISVHDSERWCGQSWQGKDTPRAQVIFDYFEYGKKKHPESYLTCACHATVRAKIHGLPQVTIADGAPKICTCGVKLTGGLHSTWCDAHV